MIPWFLVTVIFVLQGVSRVREWPSPRLPLPLEIGLSLSMVVVTRYAAKSHWPRLIIVALAVFTNAAARLIYAPPFVEGAIWILWACLLLLFTIRGRSQISEAPSEAWAWWKIVAIIGLVVFLLLPPGLCG
jgi:hypothetical protein